MSASKKPVKQHHNSSEKRNREITGVLLLGLTILFAVISFSTPTARFAEYLYDFIRGISGDLYILFLLIMLWVSVLVVFTGRKRELKKKRIFALGLLFLCVFTVVEVFVIDRIIEIYNIEYTASYANGISFVYKAQMGGGVIGALLGWPLHEWFGTAGAVITVVVILFADFIALDIVTVDQIVNFFKTVYKKLSARFSGRDDAADKTEEFEPVFKSEPEKQTRRPVPARKTVSAKTYYEEQEIPDMSKETKKKKSPEPEVRTETASDTEPTLPFDLPLKVRKKTTEEKAPEKKKAEPVIEDIMPEKTEPLPEQDELFDIANDEPLPQIEPDKLPDDDFVNTGADVKEPVKAAEKHNTDSKPIEPVKVKPFRRDNIKPAITQQDVDKQEVYYYPPIDLMSAPKAQKAINNENADRKRAETLISTLESFGINAKLTGISHGPTVTRFELSPAPGIKVSRISSLADDIALNLAAVSVRIEAPIPGKAAVGVEVPNEKIETVPLREVLESPEARKHPSRLAVALGKDNAGRFIIADLAKMPHVLVAGQTGSGKSVCINCIIASILYRATPDEVRLILIDPKVVELSVYNGIPHLLVPVVTDPKKAASALDWAVGEMSRRYKKFAEINVRDMKGYNEHLPDGEKPMPQIVIIIDELADLMMVTPGEVEDSICRLAQLARAAGIHLVIATQRPSVNVITGVIKANIPSRFAFTVASQVDSRTILDVGGAEKLLGRGDMLYAPSGINKPLRVQGAWVSDDEISRVVDYIRERHDEDYSEDMIDHMENAVTSDAEKEEKLDDDTDDLYQTAVEAVVEAGQASVSMLQRKLRVGYARAGRLIDEMEKRGVVGASEGAKPREVLWTREQMRMNFSDDEV